MNLHPNLEDSFEPNLLPFLLSPSSSFARRAILVVALSAASLAVMSQQSMAGELLFSQFADGQSAYGPSEVWPSTGVNSEVADDFNVVANIDRVSVTAYVEGSLQFQGVYVRFYQFGADNKPGALQREYFLAAGSPSVVFDKALGTIDATLSPAFSAAGRHFVSVQPVINYWYSWSAHSAAVSSQPFYFRNNTVGEGWHHGDNLNASNNADVAFQLYGTVTGPGFINSLSADTLPRSGFLEIFGSNFGAGGTVLVGGIAAPVADWSSSRVIVYVPESTPLATVAVKVVNSRGGSNSAFLSVTARASANGRVNWRFRMDGPYSEVRPVIADDQTVYAIDAFFHLYALTPDGALKWLVRGAGDKGVSVGRDGTVYVASESFINAYNPDGSTKWHFVQNPRAFICLGVSVGPDGNIYSVSTEGLGVFSLTPAGALRWQQPERYDRPIVDYQEIVFGPNGKTQQLYFSANNHIRAVALDGTPVFTVPRSFGQPAVSPDGSVHFSLSAFSPTGNLLWTFASPYPYNVFTPPDVGSDGVHYFAQNLIQLFALNPNGSQRWHLTLNNYVDGPIVDPLNTQLVMGSADTLDHPGFVLSDSATDGRELWRVTLPPEDPAVFNPATGTFGFNQFVSTRARFTSDAQTAYMMTATATGDNNTSQSFVYSLNAGNNPPPTALSVRSTSITLSANLVRQSQTVTVTGQVMAADQNGAAAAGVTVVTSWKFPKGAIQRQSALTSKQGVASFNVKGGTGTYRLTVTNMKKPAYTFDAANSVLSRTITR